MAKHISRDEFAHCLSDLIGQLSNVDRRALMDGWAGYRILTEVQFGEIIALLREHDNPEFRRDSITLWQRMTNGLGYRDEQILALARQGKTDGEIQKQHFPGMTREGIKKVRWRHGQSGGRAVKRAAKGTRKLSP